MDFGKLKFLICDDSIISRKKIKDCLINLGVIDVNIFEASDGEEAVFLYKENNPDLVFMDIIMPKKEGVAALEEIMEINSSAKVIMASSVGTQAYLTKAIELGANSFLQKPIEPSQVVKVVLSVLEGGN